MISKFFINAAVQYLLAIYPRVHYGARKYLGACSEFSFIDNMLFPIVLRNLAVSFV